MAFRDQQRHPLHGNGAGTTLQFSYVIFTAPCQRNTIPVRISQQFIYVLLFI